MQKTISVIISVIFSMSVYGQCYVYDIPLIDTSFAGQKSYVNSLDVNSVLISSSTGYQISGNSYQFFSSPYIDLKLGSYSDFFISYYSDAVVSTIAAWIDFNGDSIFSNNEQVYLDMNNALQNAYFNVYTPTDAVIDTVKMRIIIQTTAGMWGDGPDDACNIVTGGEIEEYLVALSCDYNNYINYDQYPVICYSNTVEIFAQPDVGDLLWYTDTNSASVFTGNNYSLSLSQYVPDTIIYFRNVNGNCTDGPFYRINISLLENPQIQILAPDTVQACTATSFSASSGYDYYIWNTGDVTQNITINQGFGGLLTVVGMYNNGCESYDYILASIAPDPPSSYVSLIPGSSYCSDHSLILQYDSLTSPGTCTWYSLPSLTLLGTGSGIEINGITDTVQVMACINSVCGTDTAYAMKVVSPAAVFDSLYIPNSIMDPNGIYNACFSGGNVSIVMGGLVGNITQWFAQDTLMGSQWLSLPGSDTLLNMPSGLAQQGHVYAAFAVLTNDDGCSVNSDTIYLQPANTITYNLPDTTWMCNFPSYIGIQSVDYGVYDILWNTGDTTNAISVSLEGLYTITTIDNVSGCQNSDHTYVKDGSNIAGPFQDVTFVCDPDAFFMFDYPGFNLPTWTEYDDTWNYINDAASTDYLISGQGFNEYLVLQANNSYGCEITDTTFVDFSGNFTFSLGNDVTVSQSSYTINGPYGYPSYTWSPGGETTQSVTVTSSGIYTLTIENGQGCSYSDAIQVTLQPSLSQESVLAGGIKLYPNPAKSKVNIESAVEIDEIKIIDVTGRVLIHTYPACNRKVTLDISSVPVGYYVAEIHTLKGNYKQKLVIAE